MEMKQPEGSLVSRVWPLLDTWGEALLENSCLWGGGEGQEWGGPQRMSVNVGKTAFKMIADSMSSV